MVTLFRQVGDVLNELDLDVEVFQLCLLLDILLHPLLQTYLVVQTRWLYDECLLILGRVVYCLDVYLVEVSLDGRVRRRLGWT